MALAQQTYDRQAELFERKVLAQATVDTATRNLDAAKQGVAEAAAERARLAYSSEVGGVNTTVARLQADLANAQYDLSQTTVTAPTDGYVTQLFLHPGMLMTGSPTSPALVFIHTDDQVFAASFPQNTLQRVRPDDEVEIAFDAVPGRIFKGKVAVISDAVAQGQLQASGAILNPEDRSKAAGRALTRITITDDLSAYHVPVGATAQVAVYSDHLRPVAAIRRILLRMKSWLNYLVLES